MLSSVMSVAIVSFGAEADEKKNVKTVAESSGKVYSMSEIYTDYLYPHTDKTSEVESDNISYEYDNANTDDVYAAFKFSQVSENDETTSGTNMTMSEKANDLLKNDTSMDNPLSGFSFVRPEELLIGQINRNDQHKGDIVAIDNVKDSIDKLSNNIDDLSKAGDSISLSEDKAGQTHNAIGIDYNGDDTDELAYFSLYSDGDGYASVRTYKRSGSSTLSWEQVSDQNIQISTDNEILDIETHQSKGYTAMTASDFDADGYEELACYFPCANNGCGEPFVGIIDISKDGNFNINDMKKIYLSSIRSDLNDLQPGNDHFENWYMPIVALSTTSIRANGATDNKKSYDDLVINISIPHAYYDNDVNMNSCLAIYSYNGSGYSNKFEQDLKYGLERMTSINSVDADLNGDGYNELVVAGLYATGLSANNDEGTKSSSENFVQLIFWDGEKYDLVWSNPKKIKASGQVALDWYAQEPIAITAGRYSPNTPVTMDYLCVQGIVVSCQNAKVYGTQRMEPEEGDKKYVIDTLPYMDKQLYDGASFRTEYETDIKELCDAADNAFISTADSGMLYVAGGTETIVLLTGDESASDHDNMSYDVILLSCDSAGNWLVKAYDDYIHNQNEDDKGTYMSVCFTDCDDDKMYYRYKGKTVGYSSPTLYSVVQAPPYYEENNEATVRFTVTHGTESGTHGDWGIGAGPNISIGETFEGELVAKYVGSCTNTKAYETSTSLTLYANQDYAVSMVVPIVISIYDVYYPNGNNGEGKWEEECITNDLKPALAALPIDEYNRLASELEDEEQRKAAPVIEDLPDSSAGNPYEYNHTFNDLKSDMSVHESDLDSIIEPDGAFISNDSKSKSNEISVSESSETEHGFELTFSGKINFKLKGFLNMAFEIGGGATWISSSSHGLSFLADYDAIRSDNRATIDTESSKRYEKYVGADGKLKESNITHYQSADYIYSANPIAYPSDKLTNKLSDDERENDVYLLSFYTDSFGGKPPILPEYFGVQSVKDNGDGTCSLTLAWKNDLKDTTDVDDNDRTPDAFNIYVKSLNADTVTLVNKEGPIYLDKENSIMTYKIEDIQNLSKDYVFYIAAAYVKESNGDRSNTVTNVYESILGNPVTLNIDNFQYTDGIIITKQPENFYAKNVGDEATFSIEAFDSKGETENLYYYWQTYNSEADKWEDASGDKSFDPKTYVFVTTKESFGLPIRCLVTKNKSTAENYTATSNAVTVVNKHTHKYNDNGFCTICGQYQPAVLKGDVYEISNAGMMFWFASLVNNDSAYADFDKQNTGAKAVLVKDIDLENREWKPIMNFSGSFDGQGYSISGFKITSTTSSSGLFGSAYGTVADFTLNGEIKLSADGDKVGGVVGSADGATISNITSYVNISNTAGELKHVGGIIGYIANKDTFVDKCVYYGTLNVENSHDCIGGIVGYSSVGARISNCANHGNVSASKEDAYVGGILGYVNNASPTVKDCYNYGNVDNSGNTKYCGAIIGWARNYTTANIDNNYYLDSSSNLPFGSEGMSGATATAKSSAEFKSGEVAYLLNHKVTDGTQVWYQNIDNGKTPDDYPKFTGGTVYYLEYRNGYSNFYSEKPEFDVDEDDNFIIKTYDDLVKLSNLVRSDYDLYGKANYILNNNIKAPDDSEWTQGIGSAASNKPFNGTFNGNGYCIIGLNVNSSEYGGLFEIIGEQGCVEDLFVFDCDFSSYSKTAGGIAAVNNGTIDHCISGVNFTSGTIYFKDRAIKASALNSSIKGEIAGGIAGKSSGSIKGCRNASIVSGKQCSAGIAGENTGKIFGCANNAKIGSSSSSVSGGLVGKNKGLIESSYNSGSVNGSNVKTKGSIAGINGYDEINPTVKNVFYKTASGVNAVGTDSTQAPDNTNIGFSEASDLQGVDFVNSLNAVSDESVVWMYNSYINKGYPTIEGKFLKINIKSAGNNIIVKGSMHKDLSINYDVSDENDDDYSLLSSAVGNNKILKAYSLSLTDNDGNYIPAELWTKEGFEISVPVESENVKLAAINNDGNVTYYKPDSVEHGIAVFTVSYPTSFAIVDTVVNTNTSDKSPQTGATENMAIMPVLFVSIASIYILKRRKRFE